MHDEDFSDHVLRVSGGLFRALCPKACIVRWARHDRDAVSRGHMVRDAAAWAAQQCYAPPCAIVATLLPMSVRTGTLLVQCTALGLRDHHFLPLDRGPLNKRNIIPLKFIFSEPDKYGPLLDAQPSSGVGRKGAGVRRACWSREGSWVLWLPMHPTPAVGARARAWAWQKDPVAGLTSAGQSAQPAPK